MNEVLFYLVTAVLQIVTILFVARFLLQACRADFYNPISQGIVRFTDPLLRPIRLVLPGYKNLDFAALVAVWITQIVLLVSIASITERDPGLIDILIVSLREMLLLFVSGIRWIILIVIIASFIAPGSQHPILSLLRQITEPVLAPARRLLPPMGGLDFSPILVFLLLGVIEIVVPKIFATIL
ncbi:MAG: YggT family protein [Gammaproteobacteria bacterium]|nr:YggT family protein [Gammaproteobacteria bacterium]